MNHPTLVTLPERSSRDLHFSPRYACLPRGKVKAYDHMAGETIHCIEGLLWVTFEDDREDYILKTGESLDVPGAGKLLISGPGCYRISRGIDGLDLALAS